MLMLFCWATMLKITLFSHNNIKNMRHLTCLLTVTPILLTIIQIIMFTKKGMKNILCLQTD
jgi:hypothetical protein